MHPEDTVEGRHAAETGRLGDFADGLIRAHQQVRCHVQPFPGQVFREGNTRKLFEHAGKIVFGKSREQGGVLQRHFIHVVLVDIRDGAVHNRGVDAVLGRMLRPRRFQIMAPHHRVRLKQIGIALRVPKRFLPEIAFHHFFQQDAHLVPQRAVGAEVNRLLHHGADAGNIPQIHEGIGLKQQQVSLGLRRFSQGVHTSGRQDQDLPRLHAEHFILKLVYRHAAVRHDHLNGRMAVIVIMRRHIGRPDADGGMLQIRDVFLTPLQDAETVGKPAFRFLRTLWRFRHRPLLLPADEESASLTLYAAQRHAGNKILLQEGIYHQDGHGGNDGNGAADGDRRGQGVGFQGVCGGLGRVGACLGSGQLHFQQVLQGMEILLPRAVQMGIEPAVPAANSHEQRHRRQHRRAQRENDLPVHADVPRAVDAGGFHQGVRQTGDIGADHDHVEAGEHGGDDIHPIAFGQAQGFGNQKIIGDQAGVDVHGQHHHDGDKPPQHVFFPGQGEGQHARPEQVEQGDNHCLGSGDPRGLIHRVVRHDGFVALHAEYAGPQADAAANGVRAFIERISNRIDHRIQRHKHQQGQHDGIDNRKHNILTLFAAFGRKR